jgi:hypothetical protein
MKREIQQNGSEMNIRIGSGERGTVRGGMVPSTKVDHWYWKEGGIHLFFQTKTCNFSICGEEQWLSIFDKFIAISRRYYK